MRPSQLFAAVMALSSVSAAFDLPHNVNALGDVKDMLLGRQDGSSSADASPTDKAQSTDGAKPSDNPSASATPTGGNNNDNNNSDKPSGTASGSASGSGNKSGSKSSKPTPTEFGNDVQPGGVAMITPNAIAGAQFYKIGNYVTFAWNYTSLSVSPTAVDVLASCTVNQATYTIAVNQSIQATQTVVWNTSNYQSEYPNSPPLLTENYQLMIYDSNSSVSAAPKPGYLSPYTQLTFGMYQPQPYVSWENFKCANCNSAISAMELLTFKVMLVTSATTIGSFLYFTASFGLW